MSGLPPTLLIVDDMNVERKILKSVLEKKFSATILETDNGEDCLKIVQEKPLDLLLLDIQMPKTTGMELLKQIRKNKSPLDLPIIMVSGSDQDTIIAECLQLGANDYITKPIHFDICTTRIKKQLDYSEAIRKQLSENELKAIKTLIVTYNHEINSPLAAAFMQIDRIKSLSPNQEFEVALGKLEGYISKIQEIVKKIEIVSQEKSFHLDQYGPSHQRIKL